MATTTTNFGWDIPQSTDLVKDGATAIAALGQDIDTAFVDFKGGTTGQVLKKTSGTDLDVEWGTASSGLTLINTTSFSAVSSVSLPTGTFSATYKNYKILTNCSASVGAYLSGRLRVSGTDNSASAYTSGSRYVQYNPNGNPTSDNQSGVGTSWTRVAYINADDNQIETNLMNPFVTGKTSFYGFTNRATDSLVMMVGGSHSASTSFDSFTLIPVSGTITGSVSVYGYNV
jgi:hypothetical protein